MNNSSDSLFALINSLSKAEKRYFKVFSGKDSFSSKGYLVLFDVMSSLKKYDREILDKKIKEKNLLTNLLKTRQYLFDAIIKSLIFYYSENDNEFKTRLQLMQLLVLNKKELFGLAQKKLKIFERNCVRQNRTLLLAETYSLMKSNAFNLFLNNYDSDIMHELMLKEENNLLLLMNESKFRSLMMQVLTLIKNESRLPQDALMAEYEKLESNPLLQDAGKAKTLRSKLIYLSLMSIIRYKLEKNEDALKNASEYLNLLEKNKHLLKRNTFYYFVGLRNKIIALRKLGRKKEVLAVLDKLKDIKCQNTNQEVIKARTYNTFSLLSLIDSREFEKATKLIPEIERELDRFGAMIDRNSGLQMRLLMAEALFGNKDFDQCITMLNRLLSESQIKDYITIGISSKILLLLSHYELGNLRLTPSVARAILRQMKKEGFENSFEYSFVKAFQDKNIGSEVFQRLISELEVFIKYKKQPIVFDLVNMEDYLQQKAKHELVAIG